MRDDVRVGLAVLPEVRDRLEELSERHNTNLTKLISGLILACTDEQARTALATFETVRSERKAKLKKIKQLSPEQIEKLLKHVDRTEA